MHVPHKTPYPPNSTHTMALLHQVGGEPQRTGIHMDTQVDTPITSTRIPPRLSLHTLLLKSQLPIAIEHMPFMHTARVGWQLPPHRRGRERILYLVSATRLRRHCAPYLTGGEVSFSLRGDTIQPRITLHIATHQFRPSSMLRPGRLQQAYLDVQTRNTYTTLGESSCTRNRRTAGIGSHCNIRTEDVSDLHPDTLRWKNSEFVGTIFRTSDIRIP